VKKISSSKQKSKKTCMNFLLYSRFTSLKIKHQYIPYVSPKEDIKNLEENDINGRN